MGRVQRKPKTKIEQVASVLEKMDHCALLRIYRVNYIRFREQPPTNLNNCTAAYSPHFLKVIKPLFTTK